jgi:hypothetical protein
MGIKTPETTRTGDVVSMAESLSNAEDILRGLSVGVSAFNRWSFTNRGDLDGQWQLIRTWNLEKKEFYKNVEPEPVSYYGYAIISRFLPKHSTVVSTDPIEDPDIFSQTIKTPSGELTTFILNKSSREQTVEIKMDGNRDTTFYLYRAVQEEISKPVYKMNPIKNFNIKSGKSIKMTVPAESIHALTTIHLLHEESAIKNR